MPSDSTAHRLWRKSTVPLVILAVLLGGVWWLGRTNPTSAGTVEQYRIAGETRFATAAAIALHAFDAAERAHLVTAVDFPDALAAAFAAGAAESPLLLTGQADVPNETLSALTELDVDEVVLVGGESVIGAEVENVLATVGYDVTRIEGGDRYDTAAAVALAYGDAIGELAGQRTAILSSGDDFPDALAAGPIAASARLPLFLTPPDAPAPEVDAALEQLGIDSLLVIGGQLAVAPEVVEHYEAAGYEVERIAGQSRLETATLLADIARDRLGWEANTVILTRGDSWPDAVAGTILAARAEAPLLLTADAADLGVETASWLDAACEIDTVRALGGEGAISDEVLAQAAAHAAACRESGG